MEMLNYHIDEELSARWDREWLQYLAEPTNNPRVYFVSHEGLKSISDLRDRTAEEVYNLHLFSEDRAGDLGPIRLWVNGNDIIGKKVLEIGCGAGFSGKQLSKFAAAYLGIDYSQLALQIARLTSPENCFFYHISDIDGIAAHKETVDLMVCRDFFIHQNYKTALTTVRLASGLLKPGGTLTADFFVENLEIGSPVTHPASSDLDGQFPSCAFVFSMEEISLLAQESGLVVEEVTDRKGLRRRFVRYRKPDRL